MDYCILAQARSGSTMLVHLLNQHPQLMNFGEVDNEKVWKPDLSLEDRLGLCEYTAQNLYRKWGIKIILPLRDREVSYYVDLKKPIILLLRDNMFETYVSEEVAKKTNQWHILKDYPQEHEYTTIVADIERLEMRFAHHTQEFAELRSELPNHLLVTYEQLIQNTTFVLTQIHQFLNVVEFPHFIIPTIKTGRDVRLTVENYKEVSEHFRDSEWKKFFLYN